MVRIHVNVDMYAKENPYVTTKSLINDFDVGKSTVSKLYTKVNHYPYKDLSSV